MWQRGLGFRVKKNETNTRSCFAAGASEWLQTVGLLTPNHRLKGWHLLSPFKRFSATVLPSSLATGSATRAAPLGVSPCSSAHGGPRRCGAQMMITALRCMLRTSLPLLERQRQTLPAKSPSRPHSLLLSLSLSFLVLHYIAPSFRHFPSLFRSLSLSLSLGPPTRPPSIPLDSVHCNSCHLRTTASFINYASPGWSMFLFVCAS